MDEAPLSNTLNFKNLVSEMSSATISSTNLSDPTSWSSKQFLTFDLDWAHDDVILDTVGLLETHGVGATWFVSHDTPVISQLRKNSEFERGIHPNFNRL